LNVAQAIAEVQPWAVDVAGGVESSSGVKDADLVKAFILASKRIS
jgi:phosphoribosylanthranilate isomerase